MRESVTSSSAAKAAERFREFASKHRGDLFVCLIVFADESGTHDKTGQQTGSEAAGVAGYIGFASDWEKFCVEWQAALDKHGIPWLHAKELPKDDPLLYEFAPIARRGTLFGVASMLSVRDYSKHLPLAGRDWVQHPYFFTLYPFYNAVLEELRKRNVPITKVNFVFGLQTEFEEYAIKIFRRIKREANDEGWIGDISFADMRDHLELQAADLLAHRARRTSWRILQGLAKGEDAEQDGLDISLDLGKDDVVFTLDDEAAVKRKAKAFLIDRRTWNGETKEQE